MKSILLAATIITFSAALVYADEPYHFVKEIPTGGDGGRDYLSIDSAAHRLYVSRGDRIVAIDLAADTVF